MRPIYRAVLWGLLLSANVLVPYLLLAERGRFDASFLFWTVLTGGVLLWAWQHTRQWGTPADDEPDKEPV
ncbi:hypothetical protein [Spirochaeta africana]|uniref:Uncharacterized protein n=1 Tax=Spirochaeta africana (strain ATCC 700263 / DSM 8902 / Z-7692) TaxID=889378 RepID=H9UG02_SPIAZ|nr:hypothetical protein [Spirochaeta africana]AFG36445.1 hypothetical protein Spiaf_0339 [Spirochaeta africana DSM 8902]